MSDLNVTAPPFAPPDSNRVDVPARDNHVAPHPPTPSTRDIEGVRGDDDFDVSVVDPALATTVDAATRAAKENYELVRALCQLLTSTRAQVARLEHRLAQVEAGGAKRKAPPVPSSSSVQGRSEKPPVVVVIAPPPPPPPPPTPTTPASTGGESPTRSPVRRTASKFSWAEDDEDAPLPCVPAVGSLEASPSSTPLVPAEEPGIRTVVLTVPTLTDVEARASFSAVVEGPRAPTPDSFPDSFPALGDAEEELDGEVNAYGETVSTLGAHHEPPPVSTTDGEDDGSDSRFYDTRVRGYEQTVYEDAEDDGSDSIDPNNPVINVMRLPDAFVERHLWDLPELLTPHGRYPLEYDDAVAQNPALEDGFQRASREPNDDRVNSLNSSDDDGFRKVRKPSSVATTKAKDARANHRSAGQIYARACDVLALLCEAVGLGVPSRVKIRRVKLYWNSDNDEMNPRFTASIRFDRWTHGGIKALMIEAANDDPGGYVRVHNFYAGRFVDVRRDVDQRLAPPVRGGGNYNPPWKRKVKPRSFRIAEFDLGAGGFSDLGGIGVDGFSHASNGPVPHPGHLAADSPVHVPYDDMDSARHLHGGVNASSSRLPPDKQRPYSLSTSRASSVVGDDKVAASSVPIRREQLQGREADESKTFSVPTRTGWFPTDERRDTLRRRQVRVWEGPCKRCGVSTRVPFRPVVGGKPPECSRCCQDELARKRL